MNNGLSESQRLQLTKCRCLREPMIRAVGFGSYCVWCDHCKITGDYQPTRLDAALAWNRSKRTFTENEIKDLQSVFTIAVKKLLPEGRHDQVADVRSLYERVMRIIECENDTDGDGDCHRCHKKGGCRFAFSIPK